MKYTANYNLKKPEGTDVINIDDLNDNADIIDSELKKLNTNKVDKVAGKGLSTNDYTDAEKNKLAGIEEGAQKNKVYSVNGKTGAVTITKNDVGLGNVTNNAQATKKEFDEHLADFTKLKNKLPIATGEYIATENDARIINIGFIPALLIIEHHSASSTNQYITYVHGLYEGAYIYKGMRHDRSGSIVHTPNVDTELFGKAEGSEAGFIFPSGREGDRVNYFAFGDPREVIK